LEKNLRMGNYELYTNFKRSDTKPGKITIILSFLAKCVTNGSTKSEIIVSFLFSPVE
jgi:hypothetical protein